MKNVNTTWYARAAVFAAAAVIGCRAMAEKPKFDPCSLFGIALDSHLPFDQESHSGDKNYVLASVEGMLEDMRVWGRRFRGFTPYFVAVGNDDGVESVTAIRGEDLARKKLPALFKAFDGYLAGFSGVAPSEGRSSETNRTWEGVSPDGIGYSINVYESIRNRNDTSQIRLTLCSESARVGAERRAAKLEKEDKSRVAAAYRMMQDKAYQGYWSCWRSDLALALCFVKGGIGYAEFKGGNYMFYWTADERGNVEGMLALGEGLNAKMNAKFIPETNEFAVRLSYPQDKEMMDEIESAATERGHDPRKDALAECMLEPVTLKDKEARVCDYLKRKLHDYSIRPPLARTVPEKLSAQTFESRMAPTATKELASWRDLPDFANLPKRGSWVVHGGGLCRLRIDVDEGGGTLVVVTIGERVSCDTNAPSYFWLKSAMPQLADAAMLGARVLNGLPDEQCERIAEIAEKMGANVEEKSLVLDMFWHYRREDQLHISFHGEAKGKAGEFVKSAIGGTLKFPAKLEIYETSGEAD